MKILRCHKFIYGSRIYRAGDIIPDGADTGFLEATGNVEIVPDNTSKKTKREKNTPPPVPPAPHEPGSAPEGSEPVENVGTDS